MISRRMLHGISAVFMLLGILVLTWGFRDLPIDERPEWMVAETVIWPLVGLGIVEAGRLLRMVQQGLRVTLDRTRLILHGVPALAICVLPAGSFTNWFGPGTVWSLLDFPTAKVMAAFWLALTLWAGWEVRV
ncbi:hypothetical protein TPY_3804 [Sulfobacillus acidophilus TPY]|uniref:Uncharacterized protein n=1 Tax=Sulfobacillus acidophilus (strain ATCC 700253 / DSM 10332 / NAL) TaxID=679936 RepID=G8TUX1_SULAD|nr:hypothetical protein TPY_3804 [Sulfobacillus acidophilus TPY]AEW06936.1 hypothetical protein Sulac_3499 [Sulfobacillus acidophilus DSM 10332]